MKKLSRAFNIVLIAAYLLFAMPVQAFQPKTSVILPQRKIYRAVGVIEDVNRAESWIKIKHKNIPDLMPAMTMVFEARDKRILRNRKIGEKIEFWFEEKSFVVVKINSL